MEDTILKMQENLKECFFVAFISATEDQYYPLTKDDDIDFIDKNTAVIRRKSGFDSIINLNLIVEISVKRGLM